MADLYAMRAVQALTVANGIDLNGDIRTIAVNASTSTISGAITNTSLSFANLTKTGSGTLVCTLANTYTGTTTLSGGLLSVSTSGNMGAASANLELSNQLHGQMDIAGTINYETACAFGMRLERVYR